MNRIFITLTLVFWGLNVLQARPADLQPPKCGLDNGAPPTQSLVEGAAVDAWNKCDMRCSGQPGPFHIMLIGDSVGALFAAEPQVLAWQINGAKSKSWDYFLTNPKPDGPIAGSNWRVLNTAVSGMTSGFWRQKVEHCLGTLPATQEEWDDANHNFNKFDFTAPQRVWIEIGGNDIRYAKPIAVNPHWAHYLNNAILNNVGRMVYLFQRSGRTVLLMGYHSEKASSVSWDPSRPFFEGDLVGTLCGIDTGAGESGVNVYLRAKQDSYCVILEGARQMITQVSGPIFDGLNRMRSWFDARLGPFNPESIIQEFPGASYAYGALRQIDLNLGRALGLGRSLTGLFEDPAERFRGKHKNAMEAWWDRFSDGIPWMDFWKYLQSEPRYEEGWAVVYSLPNKAMAESAMITIYGRRLKESYYAQGIPVPGTNRRTVEYVSAESEFKDPFVQWSSKSELMADDVHPLSVGYEIYGRVIAQKLKDLHYDTALGDYDFTSKNVIDWTPLPEDPINEDINILLLCFWMGICKP